MYKDMSDPLYKMAYGNRAEVYEQQAHRDEMAMFILFLKVMRILDVENRQLFQLLASEFGAQILYVSFAV
jgi:hypothetical protein